MGLPRLPAGFSWAENIAIGTPEVYRLSQISWPRFLLEESDMPDPILKFEISQQSFEDRFKIYGIRDDESGLLVAFIQAVLVEIALEAEELPDLGWRFSIQNAATESQKNAMSLVEASIDSKFRGHGLSKLLIERVKQEARSKQFSQLIAPVRPTMKVNFPDESIEIYCRRKDAQSRIFDPWLRTHVDAGAVISNICHQSVCIKASLQKWREWTGVNLSLNNPLHIEGALMPLVVDVEAQFGTYTEPNIWVRYYL